MTGWDRSATRPQWGPTAHASSPLGRGVLVTMGVVLLLVLGSAQPALGAPCDKKGSGKAPDATCGADGEVGPMGDEGDTGEAPENGNGNAYGYGKGKAYGHDDDGPGGGSDGGGGTGGPTGEAASPGDGTGSDRSHSPRKQTDDDDASAGGTGGAESRTRSQGSTSDRSSLPTQVGSVAVEAAPAPLVAANLATAADWDLAGPQPIPGQATLAQVTQVRDRRLLATALTTAETLAFPMSLSFIVVVFLFVQAYIDRDDPKLQQAALKREVYEFS